jgi:radical SAM protein with 4Fe4S-binding SPASM domain
MSDAPMAVASGHRLCRSVRVIQRGGQTALVSLARRKWAKLATRHFESLRAHMQAPAAAAEADADALASRMRKTILWLEREGYLTREDAPREPEPAPRRFRRSLHVHILNACNLACRTCYASHLGSGKTTRLSLPDFRRLLRVAREAGFQDLTLTGGEPLMHPDLPALLEVAREFDSVQLNTNGILLSPELARKVEGLTDSLNVSLDGASAEVNDALRGAGTFDRVIARLRALKAGGFDMSKLCLRPTVTRENWETLEGMLDLADGLGTRVSFGFFTPEGRGGCNREQLTIANDSLFWLFEAVGEHERRKGRRSPAPAGVDERDRAGAAPVKVGCNIEAVVAVDAEGSIFPCPNLMFPEFRIGELSRLPDLALRDALVGADCRSVVSARTVDNVPVCRDCDFRYFCGGGCMAHAYVCTGDVFGQDPYCGFYKRVWERHGPLAGPTAEAAAES